MIQEKIIELDKQEVDELLTSDCLVETIEGCLLDNYLFQLDQEKYLIVIEEYRNCWTSANVGLLTTDESKVDKFIDLASQNEDEDTYLSLEGVFFDDSKTRLEKFFNDFESLAKTVKQLRQ